MTYKEHRSKQLLSVCGAVRSVLRNSFHAREVFWAGGGLAKVSFMSEQVTIMEIDGKKFSVTVKELS